MRGNGVCGLRLLSLVLSVLLASWSSVALAAPVVGSLRADDVAIANRLLNAMIEKGTSSEVAIVRERMTRSDTVVEDNNMVVELLSATGSQVVAALQEASIAGKVEVRAG